MTEGEQKMEKGKIEFENENLPPIEMHHGAEFKGEWREVEFREGICQNCSCANYPVWFAPNELWNKVCGDAQGNEEIHFLCPTCFTLFAEEKGIVPDAWVLTPKQLSSDNARLKSEVERLQILIAIKNGEVSRRDAANYFGWDTVWQLVELEAVNEGRKIIEQAVKEGGE